MFASPVAPPAVLPSRDILRFLRLITSPACRGERRVPISAIAVMCGVSRYALYSVLWTGRASEELCTVLTPLVRDFEAGKLRFRRSGRYGDGANRWEIVDR